MLCASVKSVEDHGYIVDFCVDNKTGFLLRKNAAEFVKSANKGKPLCLGQVIQCLVLPGADARSVPVSINPSQVGGALLSGDTLLGMNALLPGLLVNAAVKEVSTHAYVYMCICMYMYMYMYIYNVMFATTERDYSDYLTAH